MSYILSRSLESRFLTCWLLALRSASYVRIVSYYIIVQLHIVQCSSTATHTINIIQNWDEHEEYDDDFDMNRCEFIYWIHVCTYIYCCYSHASGESHSPKNFLLQYLFLLSFRFRDASAVFYCIWDASYFYTQNATSIYIFLTHTCNLIQCTLSTFSTRLTYMWCFAKQKMCKDQSSALKWMDSTYKFIYLCNANSVQWTMCICCTCKAYLFLYHVLPYFIWTEFWMHGEMCSSTEG